MSGNKVSALGRLTGAYQKHSSMTGFQPEDCFLKIRVWDEKTQAIVRLEPTLLDWVSDAKRYTRVGNTTKTVFDRLQQSDLDVDLSRKVANAIFNPASLLDSSERQLLGQLILPAVLLEYMQDNASGGIDIKLPVNIPCNGRLEVLKVIADHVKASGKRAPDIVTRTVMTLASWQYNADTQAKPGKGSSKSHFIHARDNAFHTLSEPLRAILQTFYAASLGEGVVYQGHIKAGWLRNDADEDVTAAIGTVA